MAKRPKPTTQPDEPQEVKATHCYCSATLLASGRCSETGEWPRIVYARVYRPQLQAFEKAFMELPHQPGVVCPICRGSLGWDGGCRRCYGSSTPSDRTTWTFPGHRYEREGVHWIEVEGPRRACSPEENKAAMAVVKAVLAGATTGNAFERLQDVLAKHGRLPEGPDASLLSRDERERIADEQASDL
jgi:hypothetical protein